MINVHNFAIVIIKITLKYIYKSKYFKQNKTIITFDFVFSYEIIMKFQIMNHIIIY